MAKSKFPFYALGLMSGTSADGIDGVILKIEKGEKITLHSSSSIEFPKNIKSRIRDLIKLKITDPEQSENLDFDLAQLYAGLANDLLEKNKRINASIIGCHGQTIHHSPNSDPPFSLQIGNAAEIARLTNLPVVSDFRAADLALGGQGAPLAPAFHRAIFSDRSSNRLVINIGGVSNITFLPKSKKNDVIGFDTGPGNTFMDQWCRDNFDCEFDKDGEIAGAGNILIDLLDILIKDPYFESPPPKSTGLEYFNEKWLGEKLDIWDGRYQASKEDILTTLTALTARSISDQLKFIDDVDVAYLCGGGAFNPVLTAMIKHQSAINIETTSQLGIEPNWIEAAAFAWMAYRTCFGFTSTLPSVTGASEASIAGTITQPPN